MSLFTKDIGIDLGTASVLVYIKGKGVVLREPSVVAMDKNTGKLLKVGTEAEAMLGRTPGNIVAMRPLRDGVISDYDMTERMLKEFIKKVTTFSLFKPRLLICVPSGITEVEERAVVDAGIQAGARRAYLIEEPVAAAIGAGILAEYALACLDRGMDAAGLARALEQKRQDVCVLALVDTLEYLKRGGRISKTTALAGGLLNIKPVLTIENGEILLVGKARGRKSSLDTLIDTVGRLGIDLQDQVMFICQADCQAEAETVAAQLKQRYGVKEVYINYIGPVIGSHTGPNTMGLFFVGTER